MTFAPLLLLLLRPAHVADTINVFAAASLKGSFTTIADRYEKTHPNTKIQLNFAGSQLLAAQINNGAPADVFASADQRNLDRIAFDKSTRQIFATNRLGLAIRPNLPLKSIKDLSSVPKLVVADPSVPVGRYAATFLLKAAADYGEAWYEQVTANIVSKEQDVKAVIAKVQLGEADAGVVYVTDIRATQGKVKLVEIPERMNVVAEYPVAIPTDATNVSGGKAFVRFLLSKPSQDVLKENGFSVMKPLPSLRPEKAAVIAK
jgi:molybdate transport system substrate-binding protein